MPTLLDLAGIDIPDSVEGRSMLEENRRQYFYGECGEGPTATRMIREGQYKLIYYPVGNRAQLFNVENDPRELQYLANDENYATTLHHLVGRLKGELYGGNEKWVEDGRLAGLPDQEWTPRPNRNLSGGLGIHYPNPPAINADKTVGMP